MSSKCRDPLTLFLIDYLKLEPRRAKHIAKELDRLCLGGLQADDWFQLFVSYGHYCSEFGQDIANWNPAVNVGVADLPRGNLFAGRRDRGSEYTQP